MAVTVEELQIVLGCDASQAQKTLDTLNAAVNKATSNVTAAFSKLENNGSIEKVAEQAQKSVERVTKSMSPNGKQKFGGLGDFFRGFKEGMKEVFDENKDFVDKVLADTPQIELAKPKVKAADGVAAEQAEAEAKKKVGDEALKASKKVEAYNRALSKGRKGASVFGKIFSNFGKSFHKNHGFLGKFGQTLKRVLTRMIAMRIIRGILNSVSEGMKILANSSDEAQAQLGRFTALGNAVKAQIGAAALAALNAMAGVLYNIASAAITAANAVANFFATLGGGTYFAVELAGSFDDIKESASGAGGAAKGMLAAFDELNVIGNKGGGGGGGGTGLDGAAKLAEKIGNSKLADLLLGEKWEAAGNYVAEQLNGILTDIDSFFNKVQNGGYGTKFARFLNGIFADKSLFANLGKTFGDGLNAITTTVNDFFKTFDAAEAADSFALAFSTALKTVDWVNVGSAIMNGLLDALEFVHNFIINMNWSQLVRSIMDVVNGALRSLMFPPTNLLRLLKDILASIISFIIGTLVGFVGSLLDSIGLGSLADKLENWWNGISGDMNKALDDGIDMLESKLVQAGVTTESVTDNMEGMWDGLRDMVSKTADATTQYKNAVNGLQNKTVTITTVYKTTGSSSAEVTPLRVNNTPNKNLLRFASGGIVRGETIARLAEYPGARTNPEVISPLSDLQNILANVGGGRDTARQNELLSEQNRLLRAILDKPLEVKPSIGLGEVTSMSQAMYNRT